MNQDAALMSITGSVAAAEEEEEHLPQAAPASEAEGASDDSSMERSPDPANEDEQQPVQATGQAMRELSIHASGELPFTHHTMLTHM